MHEYFDSSEYTTHYILVYSGDGKGSKCISFTPPQKYPTRRQKRNVSYLPGESRQERLVGGAAAAVGQDLIARLLPLAHVDHRHFMRFPASVNKVQLLFRHIIIGSLYGTNNNMRAYNILRAISSPDSIEITNVEA